MSDNVLLPEALVSIGEVLYGAEWQSSMAIDLDLGLRTVRSWTLGEKPVPSDIKQLLLELLFSRKDRIVGIINSYF